ncbi:hypothetical protein OF897_15370 [Chryseobacterium formosus]|uniref:DUF6705 domain-containing protein n=1 Tax=Chryseobacterium formosus TaxID=1537363 RepID=A0ABT3XUH2_9FLAO|nr:DUF6705 family protein [Chryseobacterium formosus]MCX8525297.1 hypothetical protein [Chryseobacterium formosus]
MNRIVLLLTLFFSLSCKAQTNIINIPERCNHLPLQTDNGSLYLKDITNIYAPYVGTWKWSSGNKEMTLVLLKQNKYHYNNNTDNYYQDRLVGYYIYKENGVVIADTSGDDLQSDFGISVYFGISCSSKVNTGVFIDVKKEKMISVGLEILSPTQMKFDGDIDQHSSYINGDKQRTLYSGSTFPLNMVFTKQ